MNESEQQRASTGSRASPASIWRLVSTVGGRYFPEEDMRARYLVCSTLSCSISNADWRRLDATTTVFVRLTEALLQGFNCSSMRAAQDTRSTGAAASGYRFNLNGEICPAKVMVVDKRARETATQVDDDRDRNG